ncbi:WSC domain-containing protein [Aspergillus keveii]|uniref:WSC domain-containing protein n=1 Tax=Aspergillus keveii TaxID=714993 RepID=A0ABR4GJ16_9EURO
MFSAKHLITFYHLVVCTTAARSIHYLGCYLDSPGLMNLGPYIYQSVGHCSMSCNQRGRSIMGLRNGTECWCGFSYPSPEHALDPRACHLPCSGYPIDTCGGHDGLSYYEIEHATATAPTPTPTVRPAIAIEAPIQIC